MLATLTMPKRDEAGAGRERRMFPRRESKTFVAGKRLDHSIPARRQPHLTLAVRDLSYGGLSALTDMPLGPGERLSISFPPQGTDGGWQACGRVVRCEPRALGYRVALEFELDFKPLPMRLAA